jgi:two-component system sensor histidine kinase VicK
MKKLKFFNRIHWKFITIYILLIFIAMQVIGAYFIKSLESHYANNFTRSLEQQASLLTYSVQNYLSESHTRKEEDPYRDIHIFIDQMITTPHIEIQVLDQNGVVISTSADKQALIGQKNTQIEVKRALQGTRDDTIRINPKNGHRMKILSLPVKVGDEVMGAIFLMASMEEMYQTIREINNILATGTIIALILTAVIGIALSKTITSPIKEMTTHATAMADGNFSTQVKVYGEDEIGQLAQAFNYLSYRLSHALTENAEEKNKLASILSNMSDGVIATDREGTIILMNHRAEKMFQRKEANVLGTKLKNLLFDSEDYYPQDVFSKGNQFLIELDSAEQHIIVQVNTNPLKKEKNLLGVIAVLQDVTNQEMLERERKEFVANVSHELRTPLTTMKSYLEALEDGVLTDPELGPRFIRVTQNETERMIRLVNDLLQLSKMDKKSRLYIQELDIKALLEDVADRFSVQSKQRNVDIYVSVKEPLPYIEGDRDQMIQVLDNLMSNAIKYSYDEGSIYIGAARNGDEIIISIRDEGVGIPNSEHTHIFKRFYRVDKARSRDMGGTGLGLAIAREMILAHNGTISIESEYGEGTTVSIGLPLKQIRRDE